MFHYGHCSKGVIVFENQFLLYFDINQAKQREHFKTHDLKTTYRSTLLDSLCIQEPALSFWICLVVGVGTHPVGLRYKPLFFIGLWRDDIK
jgi:hypothetical protein